jgi:hypothetical protein
VTLYQTPGRRLNAQTSSERQGPSVYPDTEIFLATLPLTFSALQIRYGSESNLLLPEAAVASMSNVGRNGDLHATEQPGQGLPKLSTKKEADLPTVYFESLHIAP